MCARSKSRKNHQGNDKIGRRQKTDQLVTSIESFNQIIVAKQCKKLIGRAREVEKKEGFHHVPLDLDKTHFDLFRGHTGADLMRSEKTQKRSKSFNKIKFKRF